MIIDLHRNHSGFTGDIAPNHQHYTEFPQRVRKAQYTGRDESGQSHGQNNIKKAIPGIRPKGRGHFQRTSPDGSKRIL